MHHRPRPCSFGVIEKPLNRAFDETALFDSEPRRQSWNTNAARLNARASRLTDASKARTFRVGFVKPMLLSCSSST